MLRQSFSNLPSNTRKYARMNLNIEMISDRRIYRRSKGRRIKNYSAESKQLVNQNYQRQNIYITFIKILKLVPIVKGKGVTWKNISHGSRPIGIPSKLKAAALDQRSYQRCARVKPTLYI